jgi:hypothetical protein
MNENQGNMNDLMAPLAVAMFRNINLVPINEEEKRIIPFLRKIHKVNTPYPNFNHPSINLEN